MVGTEDSPAHQHPTLSFASAPGDVLYKGLSTTKHPLLRIFCGLFCSNVPICHVSNQNTLLLAQQGAQVKLWQIVM